MTGDLRFVQMVLRSWFRAFSTAHSRVVLAVSTAATVTLPQAIAGVTPAETREVTVMTVWPSNAQFAVGRMLGSLYAIRFPDFFFIRLGNLIALASIPIALVLFFMRIAPGIGTRYRVTNRRVIVEKGLRGVAEKSVDLDRFDSVEVVVRPGQEWYYAGDLVFRLGNVETFRLEGVSRPDSFKSVCIKGHLAYVGVKKAMRR
jgi:hypothetical protein